MKRKRILVPALLCGAGVAVTVLLAGGGHRKSTAEKEFDLALGRATLTLYPTVVRMGRTTQTDLDSARQLASAFEQRGLGKTLVREDPLTFPLEGSFNQAKMYRQSKSAFAAYIKEHRPGTAYAAMAEYLLSTSGEVGGIHLYVIRADGEPASGILLNSHWKEFKQVKPKSVQDATKALLLRMEKVWKPAPPATS